MPDEESAGGGFIAPTVGQADAYPAVLGNQTTFPDCEPPAPAVEAGDAVTPDGPVIAIEFGRTIAGGDGITAVSAPPRTLPKTVASGRQGAPAVRVAQATDVWTFRGSHGQLRRAARREGIPPLVAQRRRPSQSRQRIGAAGAQLSATAVVIRSLRPRRNAASASPK